MQGPVKRTNAAAPTPVSTAASATQPPIVVKTIPVPESNVPIASRFVRMVSVSHRRIAASTKIVPAANSVSTASVQPPPVPKTKIARAMNFASTASVSRIPAKPRPATKAKSAVLVSVSIPVQESTVLVVRNVWKAVVSLMPVLT